MKIQIVYILSALLSCFSANSQYYLRGEIKDEKDKSLQKASILLHSNRTIYFSGISGGFGITTPVLQDSLTVNLEGYESKTISVNAEQWQNIVLKILPSTANLHKPKLISISKNVQQTSKMSLYIDDETYFQLVENEYVDARKYPNTSFSLNVNKASYSNIRRFINMSSPVPPDAVRTEELLNYFNLHYQEPESSDVFKITSQLTSCPWDIEKQLLILNINAKKIDLAKMPPGNFVFLIDASGSMDMPNRLPLLKAAFQLFVKNLRAIDTVSIVTYGGTVGIWLLPTSGKEKEKIIQSIEELTATGDTPGEAAIITAYALAKNTFIKGGNNRVILATDGDFNVGLTSEEAMNELITKERQSGVYLTCLGVGMGNFKDSKLETLAKRGNGNFAYLDDIKEAEKVLVKELAQNFYAVASDVSINLQFNADLVKEYRLIGFDNKKEAIADSILDLEGGEIGSGNSVMAVFEIIPTSDKIFGGKNYDNENIVNACINYSIRQNTSRLKMTNKCPANFAEFTHIDKELQFAMAVTMFGLKLKQSAYIKNVDWTDIEMIASTAHNPHSYLQTEFMQLIGKARKIYSQKKRRKNVN